MGTVMYHGMPQPTDRLVAHEVSCCTSLAGHSMLEASSQLRVDTKFQADGTITVGCMGLSEVCPLLPQIMVLHNLTAH